MTKFESYRTKRKRRKTCTHTHPETGESFIIKRVIHHGTYLAFACTNCATVQFERIPKNG